MEFCFKDRESGWNEISIGWLKSAKTYIWVCIKQFSSLVQARPMSKKLYIIAGCNGAGKTTASFTI